MFGLEATCTQRPAAMLTLNILTEGRGVEPGCDHLPSLNKQPVMTAIFNSLLPNFSGSSKLTRIRINSTSALPFSLAHRQNCRPYSSILMFLQIVLLSFCYCSPQFFHFLCTSLPERNEVKIQPEEHTRVV